MMYYGKQQPKSHSPVSTPTPKQLVSISAKHVRPSYLDQIPSFILVAAGHLFMRQLKMMQLNYWKIVQCFRASELRFDVQHAVHTLAMYLRVKVTRFQQMSVGVSTQLR